MPRASKNFSLQEWYVISTRPLAQHGGVRSAAARWSADTFAISTSRLQALAAQAPLRSALQCPKVIVTSPAAVRLAAAQLALRSRRGQQWFALGAGSARAVRRHGVERGSDSEALLAHPALRQVRGENIGILTAPGGRGLLLDQLRARGARLCVAQVYRRESLEISGARLRALADLPESSALLITSSEAFSALWQALDRTARTRWSRRPCVVSSDRLAALALASGFKTIVRAGDARPASLLAALADHVGTRRFR